MRRCDRGELPGCLGDRVGGDGAGGKFFQQALTVLVQIDTEAQQFLGLGLGDAFELGEGGCCSAQQLAVVQVLRFGEGERGGRDARILLLSQQQDEGETSS
ncbi:hypothetical protein [Micrococcoides hystricis]|uniref:Uncharacterized protein n=1 Tax=Micrococcoides hystricis TaxID=1572761 RepID=A0ABV6P9V4_9MICC